MLMCYVICLYILTLFRVMRVMGENAKNCKKTIDSPTSQKTHQRESTKRSRTIKKTIS